MKTSYLVFGALAVGVGYLCWRQGGKHGFIGVDAARAGAASYTVQLANLISPTCCMGCQAGAAAAAAAANSNAPAPPPNSTPSAPIDASPPTVGASCGAN